MRYLHIKTFTLTFVFTILLCSGRLLAGGGPENVLLVVNVEDATSMMLANHYIQLRNIPARNVVYLKNIPKGEEIKLGQFKEKIAKPILAKIDQNQIGANIDYIVYSSGFPTIVNVDAHFKMLVQAFKDAGKQPPNNKVLRPKASLTSVTYFMRMVMSDNPTYISLKSNRYMCQRSMPLLQTPFVGDEQTAFQDALDHYHSDNFSVAIQQLNALGRKHPKQLAIYYWLATHSAWQSNKGLFLQLGFIGLTKNTFLIVMFYAFL